MVEEAKPLIELPQEHIDFLLRILSRKAYSKALKGNPKYQNLLLAHKRVIAEQKTLEDKRSHLWADISSIRSQTWKRIIKEGGK